MDSQLTTKGWYLSEEGLKACQVAAGKENVTANDIIKIALNSDLRQIARKKLPENLSSGQIDSIDGPIVLQVQKVRNVSAPLANQDSKGAPRMLKFNLTDGCSHCMAIEFDTVSFLNMNIIPGTKVCLITTGISVMKGCILLDGSNIKVLGGEVEALKAKWEASKQVATNKRLGKASDDPPPAFTEFDSSKQTKSSRNNQGRNISQDHKNRDERNRETASKQSHAKKTPAVYNEDKGVDERKPYSRKEDSSKKNTEKIYNAHRKGDDQDGEYSRNNVKNEYKSLWNSKNANQDGEYSKKNVKNEYKSLWNGKNSTQTETDDKEEKKEKADSIRDQRGSNKDSEHSTHKDDERTGSRNKIVAKSGDKHEHPNQRKNSNSCDTDREKNPSQDYRVREKKASKDYSNNDEYDRKHERKKVEKDSWSNGKSKDQRESTRISDQKGKSSSDYDDERHRTKENRSSYRNEVSKDGRIDNKEVYSERKEQRNSKSNNEEFIKQDARSRNNQNDRSNRSSYDKGWRDSDRYDRDAYDSKYDRNSKGQSNESRGKQSWKENQYEVGNNDRKKPVVYDARNQNWYYDGEKKGRKDSAQSSDIVSVPFKDDDSSSKKDSRGSSRSNRDNYDESKQYYKKNSRNEYYSDDSRGDNRYEYNKRQQKSQNSKTNAKNFNDGDKNENRQNYHGKQNNKQSYNSDYHKDAEYGNYKYRDDRSNYNREGFRSRRQQSDDSHSSKSSRDTTGGSQGQNYTDDNFKSDNQIKTGGKGNSKYSPGKRIPLEILFGKTPPNTDDIALVKSDVVENVTQSVSNLVIPDQGGSYQSNNQYAKVCTKEIMERSLEQNQNHYNHLSQDILYMQYAGINPLNPLNQELPYQYQQTIQPVPNFQVPPTSQYVGYNELPAAAAGSAAAVAAAAAGNLNPYFSYPNPRNTFQYNPMHTQHQTIQQQLPQQQQTQTLANDVPFYSGNPYYYPVNNSQVPQLHEPYQ